MNVGGRERRREGWIGVEREGGQPIRGRQKGKQKGFVMPNLVKAVYTKAAEH